MEKVEAMTPVGNTVPGATLPSPKSTKIDEFQLNTYVGNIIQVAASSLRDVVIRVPCTTEGSRKDLSDGSTTTLYGSLILTPSFDKVNGSESPSIVSEPESSFSASSRGTPVHSERFMASPAPDAPRQEVPVQESSADPPIASSAQAPSSPGFQQKKIKSRWFKRRRKSSAVAPLTEDIEKGPQPRVAFEHFNVTCKESDINGFFTKSEHLDESGNEVFLLNTEKVPMVSKLFQGSKSKALINDLCSNVEEYIKNNFFTDKFTVVIHGGDDGAKLCSIHLAKKFYKLLKNRFTEGLNYCIILRGKFSLKAVFKLSKPFIPNDFKQKISLVNDVRELVVFHGIPDTILQYA
ncbi:uncharacterized protein LOC111319753 [Stylophora pistillata]|uniref:uncharacterized protein LOC111319753 n=1 Tax=Stylophora pistillata TaxID=50429 RepID=UPI000C0559D4|nr:uncharacterized protein LOC111319753 [Stylophora pistillata]